jgi:N-acetylmuramoyl-L-alanine amidase
MDKTDAWVAAPRGSADEAYAFAVTQQGNRLDEVRRLLDEFYRLGPEVGYDPSTLSAQAALETANWKNRWWSERLNSGSIGVTGDPAQDAASPTYASGTDAARAQMVHVGVYTFGKPLPAPLQPYISLDPRYGLVPAAWVGSCRTLEDLGGKYAAEPLYGERIARRGNAMFPALPDQEEATAMADPKVWDLAEDAAAARYALSPTERDRLLAKCYRNRGQPKIVVLHIQQGITPGSLDWHANKVSASATVYANRDGSLVYAIREKDAPWTNGDDIAPTRRGADVVRRFGGDPNVYSLTIEAEGYTGDVMPAAQVAGIVWQVKRWQAAYQIPTDLVIKHADFNSSEDPNLTRKFCPGPYYERVIEALGGGADQPDPGAGVTYPPHMDRGIARRLFGKVTGEDGKVYEYAEGGVISGVWLTQYGRWGWPEIREVWAYDDGRRYVVWDGGPPLFIGTDGKPIIMTPS